MATRSPDLEHLFSRLGNSTYDVKSPKDIGYNCIAFAAGDDKRWWDPSPFGKYYWPSSVPRDASVDSFLALFKTLGYETCDIGTFEAGFEKIALYAKRDIVMHAAKQIGDEVWVSKLGRLEDIQHELLALDGPDYGSAVAFLKKVIPQT